MNSFNVRVFLIPLVVAVAIVGLVSFYFYRTTPTGLGGNYYNQIPDNSPTANWKMYDNSQYKYSFKYPRSWVITDCSSGQNQILQLASRQLNCKQTIPDIDNITIAIFPGDMTNSLLADRQRIYSVSTSNIQISGVTGMDVSLTQNPRIKMPTRFFLHDIYIVKNNFTYSFTKITINTPSDTDQIFDQILSTFKFTNQSDPTANWKTYTDSKYNFSFKYPTNLMECCAIAGPASGNASKIITLGDETTVIPQSDAPFDGLAVFVEPNDSNVQFESYIAQEKQALLNQYRAYNGGTDPGNRGNESPLNLNNVKGVVLIGYSWDSIVRYYLLFPDQKKILIIPKLSASQNGFDSTFYQILSTFKFLR